MKSEVFNNSIVNPQNLGYSRLSIKQEQELIAGIFEQLLIFDKIIISTDRQNFALQFLINKLGINLVERLFEHGYIKIMLWSPFLATGKGRKQNDGSIDESVIYGQPPVVAGSLSNNDSDPEKNIHKALSQFGIHRDRKRIFAKRAVKNYIIPNGLEFSSDSARLVIEAYQNNTFQNLGLPFEKQPNQLDLNQRMLLLKLGHKVLETAILSKYNLKSYENFEHYEICKQNLSNIGKAFNINANANELLKLENLPNLKTLFIHEKLDFESVFKLRHLSTAKYFRKWLNDIGESSDSQEVTANYINEIKGSSRFFESTCGKFVKNLGFFGVSTCFGAAINGLPGATAGGIIGTAAEYGLGLLETYWLDDLIKGKNPAMFIDNIRTELIEADYNNYSQKQ